MFPGDCDCHCAAGTPLYILGGTNLTGTWYATCDKVNMSAESVSSPASGNLSTGRSGAGAAANPSTAGYVSGGQKVGTVDTNIGDKTVISTDMTSATSSANLSYSDHYLTGMSERSSKAYFAGGQSGFLATANKLTFSTDSNAATASANLSQGRGELAAMNGDSTKGYWAGGDKTPGGVANNVKTADKTVFSTDTTSAQTSANLSAARSFLGAGSDGSTKGYWVSGNDGAGSDILDKIVVSTDTTSFVSHSTFHDFAGYGSDGNKFMIYGGQDLLSPTNDGHKVTFATDTMAGAGGVLSQSRYAPCGFSGSAL